MILGEEYYLPGADIPQVFLEADRQAAELHKNDPKIVTKPKEIQMPFIQGCKGVKGPLVVTEDWYVKRRKKQLTEKARDKKDMQIEMMQLISQKDRLRFKLGKLDPSKKRDSKKIVAINVKLKDIEAELKMLQEQSGVNLEELDHGTRFGRFVGHFERVAKKVVKKVKKFFKRNRDVINGIASIVLPVLAVVLGKKLFGALLA